MAKARSTVTATFTFASIGVLASAGLLPMLNKSLWVDEGASLYSAHLSWRALGQQSKVVDRVFVAYYAILHLWTGISANIEWVRLPSLIAFGFTVVIVGRLGNRLGGFSCGVIAAILTASNPLMIEAALDARPYALSALAATIAINALFRWCESSEDYWIWWFCIAWVVALVLQFFAILAPLAVLVTLFALRPMAFRRNWRRIVAPLSVTLVATASFALLVLGQRGQVAWIPPMSVGKLFLDAFGPASGYPRDGKLRYAILIVVLVAFGLVLAGKWWRRKSERVARSSSEYFVVALAWAALPTLGLIAVSYVQPFYVDRYVTASAPGMALAIGLLLAQALKLNVANSSTRPRRGARIAVALIAVALIANAFTVSSAVFENVRGVAQYLDRHVGANDEVALPSHELGASVEYYLLSNRKHLNTWPVTSTQFIGALDLRENDESFDSAPRNVWLVEDGTVGTKVFNDDLTRHGYVQMGKRLFVNLLRVTIVHYQRSG